MIDIGNSLSCESDTLYPGDRLSRPWLDLERLHLRFTRPIASYGFRSSTALVLAQQGARPRAAGGLSSRSRGLVLAQQGVQPPDTATTRSTSLFASFRDLLCCAKSQY